MGWVIGKIDWMYHKHHIGKCSMYPLPSLQIHTIPLICSRSIIWSEVTRDGQGINMMGKNNICIRQRGPVQFSNLEVRRWPFSTKDRAPGSKRMMQMLSRKAIGHDFNFATIFRPSWRESEPRHNFFQKIGLNFTIVFWWASAISFLERFDWSNWNTIITRQRTYNVQKVWKFRVLCLSFLRTSFSFHEPVYNWRV